FATLAGKIAEKEGKGRGRWCCRYGLPNLPTAPLKMSRLRPRRSRIPHDLVERAFAEPAADDPVERVGHLLPREFFAGSHTQNRWRAGSQQRVASESQQHRQDRLPVRIGIPASPHDAEQKNLGVKGVQLLKPLA